MLVIFCFNKNWWAVIAMAIRFFSPKSKSSHTVIYDPRSSKFFDITFGGYREYDQSYFDKNYEIKNVVTVPIFDNSERLESVCRVYKDYAYGMLQLFGILFVNIFKMKNPFRNGDSLLICNEFCFRVAGHYYPSLYKRTESVEDLDLDNTLKIMEEFFK